MKPRKTAFSIGDIVTLFADVERDLGNGDYALKTDGGNHIKESARDMYEIERVEAKPVVPVKCEGPRETDELVRENFEKWWSDNLSRFLAIPRKYNVTLAWEIAWEAWRAALSQDKPTCSGAGQWP